METADKHRDAISLSHLRDELEKHIEDAVRDFERDHGGPIELDMSMVEGEGAAESDGSLRQNVASIVEAFQRNPVVSKSGVVVHRVTAIDSDADGEIAVRVSYEYPNVP